MCVYGEVSFCDDLKMGTPNDKRQFLHNSEKSNYRVVDSEIENDSFQSLLCDHLLHYVSFLVYKMGTLVHTYIRKLLGRIFKRCGSVQI